MVTYHSVTQRDPKDPKERVLHTRVPAVLEEELKRFAESLRVPVSNLVRNILEDALDIADVAAEGVEERLKKAATSLGVQREHFKARAKSDPLRDVFAFQEVTLAQDATCARCQVQLVAGTRAHLGLTDAPATGSRRRIRPFVCAGCLPG